MAQKKNPDTVSIPVEGGEIMEIPKWLSTLPIAETDADVSDRIASQILAADTVDGVLAGLPDTVGLTDLLDQDIVIHDVRLRPSDQEDSLGAYALVAFTRDGETEQGVFTTGSVNVLAQLVRLHQLGAFPAKVRPYQTQSKSNPKNKPLWLRPAGAF